MFLVNKWLTKNTTNLGLYPKFYQIFWWLSLVEMLMFVKILKLMLGRDSEDEIWSRFVWELGIWTQPSGPLCLWQCFSFKTVNLKNFRVEIKVTRQVNPKTCFAQIRFHFQLIYQNGSKIFDVCPPKISTRKLTIS